MNYQLPYNTNPSNHANEINFMEQHSSKCLSQISSTQSMAQTIADFACTPSSRTKNIFKVKSPTGNNRWSTHETTILLKLLRIYSTDFEIISQFLTSKSRAQIKRKFKLLEKTNGKDLDQIFRFPSNFLDEEMASRLQEVLGRPEAE